MTGVIFLQYEYILLGDEGTVKTPHRCNVQSQVDPSSMREKIDMVLFQPLREGSGVLDQ